MIRCNTLSILPSVLDISNQMNLFLIFHIIQVFEQVDGCKKLEQVKQLRPIQKQTTPEKTKLKNRVNDLLGKYRAAVSYCSSL